MPFYVADYIRDTGHLSAAEHGAYLLLIMHYWSTGGLPTEDKRLASIARLSLVEWQDSRATIAAFFKDGWRHPKIDAHIAEAEESYNRRAEAGRIGGKAKAKDKQSSSNATPSPQAPLKQSEPEPIYPSPPAPREASTENRLEAECRTIAANMPVAVDPNFIPVLKLLDEGLIADDVLTAMRDIAEKNHALRNWHGVGSWARKAAKDRLERAMPPANYARAGPDGKSANSHSRSQGKPDGTTASPSDFLRAQMRKRADDADRDDQKLLA